MPFLPTTVDSVCRCLNSRARIFKLLRSLGTDSASLNAEILEPSMGAKNREEIDSFESISGLLKRLKILYDKRVGIDSCTPFYKFGFRLRPFASHNRCQRVYFCSSQTPSIAT
jgi:hypothetical protein